MLIYTDLCIKIPIGIISLTTMHTPFPCFVVVVVVVVVVLFFWLSLANCHALIYSDRDTA